MKLYLARHTQTNYNLEQRLNSDPSVSVTLNKTGTMQAKELAKKLAAKKFDIIFTSELTRTQQTADYINKFHHVPVVIDKSLNENMSGFEGQLIETYLAALNKSSDKWREKLNNGESLEEARNRTEDFLTDLRATDYHAVLVITHGYIVESTYGIIHKLAQEESAQFQCAQGDFVVFDYE